MACSRMPKCSVRPYGSPGNIRVWCSGGMNDGSPFIVVLLLPGQVGRAAPQLGQHRGERVQHLAGGLPGGHPLGVGRELRQRGGPAVGQRAGRTAGRAARPAPGWRRAQAAKLSSHSARAPLAPVGDLAGVGEHVSSSTWKVTSGSKPRIFLVAATSSAPSAEPCASPVFCLFGAGQPMIVRSAMNDGRSVSSRAAMQRLVQRLDVLAGSRPRAASSTRCTCQP